MYEGCSGLTQIDIAHPRATVTNMESNQTSQDLVKAVLEFATQSQIKEGTAFKVTGKGVELVR
jgi:hypothetical protein